MRTLFILILLLLMAPSPITAGDHHSFNLSVPSETTPNQEITEQHQIVMAQELAANKNSDRNLFELIQKDVQ